MAEIEEDYLRQCREKNICPVCQQPIIKRIGSGQVKDGVFCSLDCFTKWHAGMRIEQHKNRMQKSESND